MSPSLDGLRQGTVVWKSQGRYRVQGDGGPLLCALSSRLRKDLVYPIADPSSLRPHVVAVRQIQQVDPVVVGDRVRYQPGQGLGQIVEVLPRRSQLSRPARETAGRHARQQVLVANVDQIVAVFSAARPAPKWRLLDRYLATAEAVGLPTLICISKVDLADEDDLLDATWLYRGLGYPVLATSALLGQGLGELRPALRDRVSILIGKSGVGKTTLLNALEPGLGRRVGEVSRARDADGRHTTSYVELVPLSFGGALVDSPGMREFGLWQIGPDELAGCFVEMRPLLGRCRFRADCSHSHEPGCAIKEAVEEGRIGRRRYESYLKLREEVERD